MSVVEAALWGGIGALAVICLELGANMAKNSGWSPAPPKMPLGVYLLTLALRIPPGVGVAAAGSGILVGSYGAFMVGAVLPLTLTVVLRKTQAWIKVLERTADEARG